MGGSAPAHTTQTTEVKLPAWVDKASQSNYELAKSISGRPLQQWGGPDVVAPSSMTNLGYRMLQRGAGSENPMYNRAAGMYGKAAGMFDESRRLYEKSAGPFDPTKYLNPEIDNVESRSIDNATRALTGQLSAADDAALKSGAFGGSAAGVQRGILAAEGARGIGDLSAELRKSGYDTAVANMFTDRAGMRDAAAGITGTGGALTTAGSALTDTANARGAARIRDTGALLGAGSQEQAQRQAVLDAKKNRFLEKRDYPLEQLNTRLAALGMSPYGKTEKMEKTSTAEKQGMDFGSIFGGIMQFLPMLFGASDRRDKTDIVKLGKSNKSEFPLYAYRYKDDPKSYPKIVGIMAQDVEKTRPDAVFEVGGHKVIDYGALASG
jgi:hypothetical protein